MSDEGLTIFKCISPKRERVYTAAIFLLHATVLVERSGKTLSRNPRFVWDRAAFRKSSGWKQVFP